MRTSLFAFSALIAASLLLMVLGFARMEGGAETVSADPTPLVLRMDEDTHTLLVYREGENEPLLTQHVRPDFRPYIHPIVAPDGRGTLTEFSPGHHPHQTGLYWGFTDVNGRDYFHHPGEGYWRNVSADMLQTRGSHVRWQTVYDLLDENGEPILRETQEWTLREDASRYVLDLQWEGEALTDVTIGAFDYGGLFLRMPWEEGIEAAAVNAARQRDQASEGERAMWLDVGMKVDGRDDMAHVAIFDHPDNEGFPHPWRVDGEFGVGPVRARLGAWRIPSGETEVIQHRLLVYTGTLSDVQLRELWEDYSGRDGQYSVTALWELAQEEGRQAEFLTPQRAADEMTLPEGYNVNPWPANRWSRSPWPSRGMTGDGSGSPRTGTTSPEGPASPTPATAASSFSKIPTAMAKPIAGRCSLRGSPSRRRWR